MLQLLYYFLMTKLSTLPFFTVFLNLKETYYFTYLFTALSSSMCTNHEFTILRHCWTFGTALNRMQLIAQLMEITSLRLRTGQRS